MQVYGFSSAQFSKSFPQCADGALIAKYHQLLSQLFPGFGVFMVLLNEDGDIFVQADPSFYRLDHPSVLLHLLTNGTPILVTDTLQHKPYQGIFCYETEVLAKFFVCSSLVTATGSLIGGFGVIGEQPKALSPDDKAFLQWMAQELAQEISAQASDQVDLTQSPLPAEEPFPAMILPYLDDIYIMVDQDGVIISLAEQVPQQIKEAITVAGGSLAVVFGPQRVALFIDLIILCAATRKKQTHLLNLTVDAAQYLFSVSCNKFSEGWFLLTFHDVTERNRMRELLEQRKQLLENIVQAGNVGILMINCDGEVLYHNSRAAEWLSLDLMSPQPKLPFMHWGAENAIEQHLNPFRQVFIHQQDIKDSRYQSPDHIHKNQVFGLSAVFIPTHASGKSTATFFMQDVSERALLEQAMLEMEQHLQFLLQASPVIIYQMLPESNGQLLYISPNSLSMIGVPQQAILQNSTFWLEHLHPEDKANAKALLCRNDTDTYEYRFWFDSLATYRWVKDIRRVAEGAKDCGWIGVLLDITERKEAEFQQQLLQQQLSATLESLADAVISINRKGQIVSANQATFRIFGYPNDQLIGRNVSMLMPQSIAFQHDGFIDNYIQTKEAKIIGIGREVNALHALGHEFPIALSIGVLVCGDDILFVGCCHDLTQFKKQQQQLLHSEKLGAVGKLTSSIAHDFNNILGIVRGYAEMLQHEGDRVASLSQPIIDASDRASMMISQLLDFSSSKQREVTLIDLHEHLSALRPLLEKSISAQITLSFQLCAKQIGVRVELPAFDNLLINMAVNANHAISGIGSLQMSTSLCAAGDLPKELHLKPDCYVKISITDDGCGMSADICTKIFEPFFTTKGEKGTGLGLAQAYGMINRCHGVIDVHSTPGKGTTFDLYLPEISFPQSSGKKSASLAKPLSQVPFAAKQQSVFPAAEITKDPIILLVDDETELLEINAMLLESAGYQVFKASHATEALRIVNSYPVTLLLSDIMMPEMNGFELAHLIKASYPSIKVQLISGFAEASMIKDAQSQLWYEQRLSKPIPMTQLLQHVKLLLSDS